MNELLVTFMLVVPLPSALVSWSINEVPTQVQLIHKSGLEVSYTAGLVPCTRRPKNSREMIFKTDNYHCYLVFDLSQPRFVRHPFYWHLVKGSKKMKKYNNNKE